MTDMPTSYETQTTTQTTSSGPSAGIGFHPEYIKTIPGILKVVEVVLSLVTFICAVIPWWGSAGGWVQFVSITAFITVLVWLIFYLIGLIHKIPPFRQLVEFIYYCVFTALFLIAAIVAAVKGGLAAAIGAAAFFAFAATAVFAVDTFFQFRAWRSGQTEMQMTSTTTTTTTTVEKGETVQY